MWASNLDLKICMKTEDTKRLHASELVVLIWNRGYPVTKQDDSLRTAQQSIRNVAIELEQIVCQHSNTSNDSK